MQRRNETSGSFVLRFDMRLISSNENGGVDFSSTELRLCSRIMRRTQLNAGVLTKLGFRALWYGLRQQTRSFDAVPASLCCAEMVKVNGTGKDMVPFCDVEAPGANILTKISFPTEAPSSYTRVLPVRQPVQGNRKRKLKALSFVRVPSVSSR
jgi:hypothetical protein